MSPDVGCARRGCFPLSVAGYSVAAVRDAGQGWGESAGMNRSGGGDGRALRRRASEPAAASSYASRFREGLAKRWQGHVQAGLLVTSHGPC